MSFGWSALIPALGAVGRGNAFVVVQELFLPRRHGGRRDLPAASAYENRNGDECCGDVQRRRRP
jgi:hypothetical protein